MVGLGYSPGWAYDIDTHDGLTTEAMVRSVLKVQPATLRYLGMESSTLGTVEAEILRGVADEDRLEFGANVRRHFFDPLTGLGLSTPVQFVSSPDWSLEQMALGNDFSLADFRQRLVQSLTAPTEVQRVIHANMAFRALGHVVHHVQDMAQPEHTRDDNHFREFAENAVLGHQSGYEAYVRRCFTDDDIAKLPPYPSSGSLTLSTARHFWTTNEDGDPGNDDRGIADFSNRNFITTNTNFSGRFDPAQPAVFASPDPNYPSPSDPVVTSTTLVDLENNEACAAGALVAGGGIDGAALLVMVGTDVVDAVEAATAFNPRTSSFGIYQHDLALVLPACTPATPFGCLRASFQENVLTYQAKAEFLLPRAIGYSASFIDHVLRPIVMPDGMPALRINASKMASNEGTVAVGNEIGRALQSGKFSVYYDSRTLGTREFAGSFMLQAPLSTGEEVVIGQVEGGQGVDITSLWLDADPAGQVAVVFEGIAGNPPDEDESIVAARVCDCATMLTEVSDDNRDCAGLCPCEWLSFSTGDPGVPNDGVLVSGYADTNGRLEFPIPYCLERDHLPDEYTLTVFPDPPLAPNVLLAMLAVSTDREQCPFVCDGPLTGSGTHSLPRSGSAVATTLQDVQGWYATIPRGGASPTFFCAGETTIENDPTSIQGCFTSTPGCSPSTPGCCDPSVQVDAALLCMGPGIF